MEQYKVITALEGTELLLQSAQKSVETASKLILKNAMINQMMTSDVLWDAGL